MSGLTAGPAIVGTPGYLSPEQAHGQPVDARSDIFCLGIVLHEMISGQRAFQGDSAAARLSAVVRDDPPPLRTLTAAVPRSLERCVARCLEKDPRRRYQNAADVKAILEDIRDDLTAPAAGDGPPPSPARQVGHGLAYASIGGAIGIAGLLLGGALDGPQVLTPTYRPFITETAAAAVPVWSPDGRTLAHVGETGGVRQVFLRGLDAVQSTQVTTEAADGITLFWSGDGTRLYFTRASDGNLVSVSAGGGQPQLVLTAAADEGTGSGGRLPGGLKACLAPDARTLVYAGSEPGGVHLRTMDLGTGARRSLDPPGLPRPLANVQALAFSPDGATLAVIASTTALNDARGVWLVSWPDGPARHAFAEAPFLASNPAIGWLPDGRRFVMNGSPLHGGNSRLLLAQVAAGTLRPLTGGQDDEGSPSVTPDGRRIAFVSRRTGLDLIQIPMDGGPPEPLLASSRTESRPDMSRSGLLAYVTDADGSPEVRVRSGVQALPRTIGGASGAELDRASQPFAVRVSRNDQRLAVEAYGAEHLIWIYPMAGGTPVRLDTETTDQHGPSWSPDGNWVAYRRLRQGTWEIVKAPLGGGPAQRLDDATPGGSPTDWSPTGDWIAHDRPDGMHLVSADGKSRRVLPGLRSGAFRFSRDGSRLIAVRRDGNRQWQLATWDVATARQIHVAALPLASTATIQGMTPSADDSHIIVAAGTPTSDIWFLEQFEPPGAPWARWLRR